MRNLQNSFPKGLIRSIIGIILLCGLTSTYTSAQFPVSVNTQLTSPSLPYLADYVREKPESLRTILLLTDDSRMNYDVLLKIRISGQGIELASRPDYFSAPINLLYNVPEMLTGFELAELFDPNNLEISGMSKSEFLKTGQLPEGIYTICFEAYDLNRFNELPVSNGGCAVASVVEHEPPYLISPTGLINYTETTVLPFNWHPGHTNSFFTEYRLHLYEKIPGWTPDQIVLYQAPLYTTEAMTTTYLYGAADPLLEKGASYFWRVQAFDPAGFELFKNNGFSQLETFTYGQDCDAPLGIQSLTVDDHSQLIRWVDSSPGIYELQYRMEELILNANPTTVTDSIDSNNTPPVIATVNPKGKDKNNFGAVGINNTENQIATEAPVASTNLDQINYSSRWTTITDISEQEYLLKDLSPHRFEIQVRRVCGIGNQSPWSTSVEIDNRTPDAPEFLLPPTATEPTEITEEVFTANWDYQTEAYFELQIARDTGFAILLPGYENLTVTNLEQTIVGLGSGQIYYYRVKAKRGDLQSAYSNVQTAETTGGDPNNILSLLALPAQPISYDKFTAHWSGTTDLSSYYLEVARDREFTQPLPEYEAGAQEIFAGVTEDLISANLLTQGLFYRIRTVGIGGEGYSNIIEVPKQYLPVPIALEPSDINAIGFTAHWESLPEASEYIIDVSISSDFSEVIPGLSNQTVTGTSIRFSQYLSPEDTTYFYQVRAKINNQTSGNSNPIVVRDGGLAVVPVTKPPTQIKKTSFWANWESLPNITTYALEVATTPDFEPNSFLAGYENKIVFGDNHKIEDVNFAGTMFYYRIRAIENDLYSIYSNQQTVSWKGCYFGPMAMDYSCGIPADPYFNEQLPLIAELEKGDTIQAGDFLVILKEVNNSSPFSGTGYIAMPFQQLRINLEFSNIKVDETCRMVDGRMSVTGAGLALISEEIADKINAVLDVLDTIDSVLATAEEILKEISDILNTTESVSGYFTNGINLLNGIDPILEEYPYLPPSTLDSLQSALNCFTSTLNFQSCKEELIGGLQVLQNGLINHYSSSKQVVFQASNGQKFGLDSIVHPAFTSHYQSFDVAGKPYQVWWKSVKNDTSDIVEARFIDGTPLPSNIRFEDTNKTEIPTTIVNGIARLTISGTGDQIAYPIYAVQTGDTVKLAGKLNLVSYDPKPVQLVVVPLNGANYPFSTENLSLKLKAIFQPAVVNLSVTVADNFQVDDFDNELDAIATGFLQSYTDEMKTIFKAYKDADLVDDDVYYIFLLPRFAATDQVGYMPRKRKFGFLNHEQLSFAEDRYVKTIAHELAHGAFVLHHTSDEHPQLEDQTTQNLLDASPTGTITHEFQWAGMHDPSRAWTMFDEDEDRGQVTVKASDFLSEYIVEDHLSFLTSHAEIISIKANQVSDLIFATGGEFYSNSKKLAPIGTLVGFTIKTTTDTTTTSTNYSITSSGNCIIRGSGISSQATKYNYEYSGLKKPIVIRPVKKNGMEAINIVQLVDYTPLVPGLQKYDFLVSVFFNNSGASLGEVKTSTTDAIQLGPEFRNELYLEFVSTYPEYAEFEKLSSFYVHGMAVPISKYTEYYQSCEYLKVEQLRSAIDLFQYAYDNQYTNPVDNFSNTPLYQGFSTGAPVVEENPNNKEHVDNLKATLSSFFTDGLNQSDLFNEASFFNGIDVIVNRANLVADYNVKIDKIKNAEDNAEEFNELRILLKESQTKLIPCELKLLDIDIEDIKALLKYMVFDNFFYFDAANGPSFILSLIELVEEEEYEDFLSFLSSTSITEEERITITSELDASTVQSFEPARYLWEQLLLMCDDGAIFGNSGYVLIGQLIEIFQKVNKENTSPFSEIITEITNIQEADGDNLSVEAIETVVKKIIPYNYTRPIKRVGTYLINSIRYPGYGVLVENFVLTELKVNENGTFNVIQTLEIPVVSNVPLFSGNYENLEPFEPVVVDMQSKFGLANSIVDTSDHKVYPAIVFYYFNQAATTTSTTDMTFAVIDGISLVFPPAYITKIRWLNKAFAIADKGSAVLSLAGSYYVDENPEVAKTLNLFSAAMGLTTAGVSGYNAISKWNTIKEGAADPRNALSLVSKNAANKADDIPFVSRQLEDFFEGINGDLINLSEVPLEMRTKIAISIQEKIDGVIDAGRSDLIDFVKAEQAIAKLIGNMSDRLRSTFQGIVPELIYDDLAKVNGVVKLFDEPVETSILALGQGNANIQKELFLDIISSTQAAGKIGKELNKLTKNSVENWEELFGIGSSSRLDFSSLDFLHKLDDYPNLKTKFLDDLDDTQKARFVEDFKNAENNAFDFFEGNDKAIDIWKNCSKDPTKSKDIVWLEKLAASPGTSKIDNVPPLDISWNNDLYGHNSFIPATHFWNNNSKNFLYYTQGDYIFKYDYTTGTLFLGKISTSEVVGYYHGAENLTNFVYKSSPDELIRKMKRCHGYSGPSAPIFNLDFNPNIASTPDKTTTIIGRGKVYPYHTGDMKSVIDELIGGLTSIYIGARKGGFNVLNISREIYEGLDFWVAFNKPWLLAAIERGDVFAAASDPMNLHNIFKNLDGVPVNTLTSPEEVAHYLKHLKNEVLIEKMTFYGKEIKLLSDNDYIFNINTKTFVQ